MLNMLYCPRWFYAPNLIIDSLSIIILTLIAVFSIQFRKFEKGKTHTLFSISFFLLALSFIFNIVTNFTLVRNVVGQKQIGAALITFHAIQQSDILIITGTLLSRFLMLLGLYALYTVYYPKDRYTHIMFAYFILITTYFSDQAYYVFHATLLLIIIPIIAHYYKNYKKTKDAPAAFILYSFVTIALSHIGFIFGRVNLYITSTLIQLVGYSLLLIAFIMVIRYGKKNKA